ncbi:hypothetical protein JKP88DRAFT_323156 [Tribonema minus]|uniref:Uncharacterized protein n=1 Tax=Tribonema minus TaxID=303371 RepID=A0A835Z222_9STRA|nr:hypothetical protein JKP88DRAFT_323156 [Tribonema minus]
MAVAASADAFALRHVLAKFPREQKTVIEECLAWHGLRVLLQAHRLDDLLGNASAVLAATEAARREVHAILREHSTRGPRPTARTKAATAVAKRRTRSASPTTPRLPRSPVKGTLRGSRQPDIPRPDVLAKYPFVDGQGNVGEILACPPRTTPFHRLAKREIRRLAKAAFMEYRSSAHGIRLHAPPQIAPTGITPLFDARCRTSTPRLRDFKSALSALFGEATYSACGGMHLILALAQEALPHSLQLVLRDTSDLGDVSTAPSVATFGMGLTEDNIEVPGNTHPVKVPRNDAAVDQSEWTRLVAHVVRRLWQMEGRGLQLGGPLVDVDASDDVAAMTDESDAHSEGGDDDGRGGTHGYPSRQPGGTAPPRRQHERSASVDPQLSASRRRVHAPRAQDRDRSAAAASAALQQPRGSSAPPGQRRRGGGGGARAAGGSSAQLQRFGRTASGSPRARTRGEGAGGRQQQRSGGGGGATADAQSAQPRRRGRGQGEAEGGALRSNLTAQRTAALGTAAEHRLNAFAAGRSSALKRGFGAAAVALDIADDFLGSSLMASLSAGRGGLEGGSGGGGGRSARRCRQRVRGLSRGVIRFANRVQ